MYLSAHKATKKLGISSDTLHRWLKQGRITAKTSPFGTRLYDISSIFPELTSQDADYTTTTTAAATTTTKKGFLYARVSSVKQKEDLERQKQLLRSQYPTYELISDIGSGVNFKRPGLKTLLERTSRGMVSEIVVTHRDRLCRFAFDLIQYILSLHTTKLVVLFNDATSDEHELSQDILAINTVFICQMQGRRAAMHRRERKAKDDKNNKCTKQKKRKPETTVNRTLSIKTYPNHSQKKILKRWLGLMRYAYNTVVRWDKNHTKPQTLSEKLKLYIDVKEGKDPDEKDKKLQRSCVWGERKFLRTVVWLGLRLRGLHNEV